MKTLVVQVMKLNLATRSAPIVITELSQLDAVEDICKKSEEEELGILVIGEYINDELEISQAPIMKLETFIKSVKEINNG